jgi:23S rRNA pseudoU1915 N3-methylase RlmH
MKVTREKLKEYAKINENGFKVDLYSMANHISHGDEYPKMQKVIVNNDEKQVLINVTYFKFYGGSGEYKIEVNEYEKRKDSNFMIGGSGKYNKKIFKEENNRFNFSYLKSLCHKIDEATANNILSDYQGR